MGPPSRKIHALKFKPPRWVFVILSTRRRVYQSSDLHLQNFYTAAQSPEHRRRNSSTPLFLLHFLHREPLEHCKESLWEESCYYQWAMSRSYAVLREARGEDESSTCSLGSGNLRRRSERIFPICATGNSKPAAASLVVSPASDSADDPMWDAIRAEAKSETEKEPILSSFLYASILSHNCLERALGFVLANRLQDPTLLAAQLMDIFDNVMMNDRGIQRSIRLDLQAFIDRDPACASYSWALLYLKGYHSLQSYRVAHALWNQGRNVLALALQSRISEVFAVDIHPAAKIGEGILLDHATGLVIGETAVIGNKVSLMQGVTLGGTGKEVGDRHPKIGQGALIGAGATILGNIVVGEGAIIAAGSLVLKTIPPHSMAVGNPARTVGHLEEEDPSLTMNHDATKDYFEKLAVSSANGKSNGSRPS